MARSAHGRIKQHGVLLVSEAKSCSPPGFEVSVAACGFKRLEAFAILLKQERRDTMHALEALEDLSVHKCDMHFATYESERLETKSLESTF